MTSEQGALGGTTHSPHKGGKASHERVPSKTKNSASRNSTAGGTSSVRRPSDDTPFYGHDRSEVTRLILQGLNDLGYDRTALTLAEESGFQVETPAIPRFRRAILDGRWSEAEELLFGRQALSDGTNGRGSGRPPSLPLKTGVSQDEVKFRIRSQKYLELLEARKHDQAVMVLRQELTPLRIDPQLLKTLSNLMVSKSSEAIMKATNWDGREGKSRHNLLKDILDDISPSVLIPELRFVNILDQVKHYWLSKCYWHNPTTPWTLLEDHMCDRSHFPLHKLKSLELADEVYYVTFSKDGTRLFACFGQGHLAIYDTKTWTRLHSMQPHTASIGYCAISPDGTRLVTCSQDKTGKLFKFSPAEDSMDTGTGDTLSHNHLQLAKIVAEGQHPVTSAAWMPDSSEFIISSVDIRLGLVLWSRDGEVKYRWPNEYRVRGCSITPNGKQLAIITPFNTIVVFDLQSRQEIWSIRMACEMTSINTSKDSSYILVNLERNELNLINIHSGAVVQRYLGHTQGKYVIHSNFGGTEDNIVVTGSEDGKIYLFHREVGILIASLKGANANCINAVAWHPQDPCLFVSASDDKTINVWTDESHVNSASSTNGAVDPHTVDTGTEVRAGNSYGFFQ